jgi:hypothetical protein
MHARCVASAGEVKGESAVGGVGSLKKKIYDSYYDQAKIYNELQKSLRRHEKCSVNRAK